MAAAGKKKNTISTEHIPIRTINLKNLYENEHGN
jgi:hypothetical protein